MLPASSPHAHPHVAFTSVSSLVQVFGASSHPCKSRSSSCGWRGTSGRWTCSILCLQSEHTCAEIGGDWSWVGGVHGEASPFAEASSHSSPCPDAANAPATEWLLCSVRRSDPFVFHSNPQGVSCSYGVSAVLTALEASCAHGGRNPV